MCRIFVLVLVVAVAVVWAKDKDDDAHAHVENQYKKDDGHGHFAYGYDITNGIGAGEAGDEHEVHGEYHFTSKEGVPVKITYTADENGYHPHSDLLPTPPPTPEAILKALEYIKAHPIKEEQSPHWHAHGHGHGHGQSHGHGHDNRHAQHNSGQWHH